MLLRSVIALAGALASLVAPHTSTDGGRTTPCTEWRGTVSGNDSSVSFTGTTCEDAKGNIEGTFTWTSKTSGTNVRKVAGAWSKNHTELTMHDVAIVDQKPKGPWRFCLVDEYDLTGDATSLSGSYHSAACEDDAKVTLTATR